MLTTDVITLKRLRSTPGVVLSAIVLKKLQCHNVCDSRVFMFEATKLDGIILLSHKLVSRAMCSYAVVY